jgi:hypothetical protein
MLPRILEIEICLPLIAFVYHMENKMSVSMSSDYDVEMGSDYDVEMGSDYDVEMAVMYSQHQ